MGWDGDWGWAWSGVWGGYAEGAADEPSPVLLPARLQIDAGTFDAPFTIEEL